MGCSNLCNRSLELLPQLVASLLRMSMHLLRHHHKHHTQVKYAKHHCIAACASLQRSAAYIHNCLHTRLQVLLHSHATCTLVLRCQATATNTITINTHTYTTFSFDNINYYCLSLLFSSPFPPFLSSSGYLTFPPVFSPFYPQ